MEISLIIGAIAIIIILTILSFVLKKVFKVLSIVFLISTIVFAVLGFFVYQDIIDMQQNWPTGDKLILVANDNVYTGLVTTFSGEEQPSFISNGELGVYDAAYQQGDYQIILGDNYKLFIIKLEAFDDLIGTIETGEGSMTKEDIIEVMKAEDSIGLFMEKQGIAADQRDSLEDEIKDNAGLKGMLSGILLMKAMEQEGPMFIFNEHKKGNIIIYPETIIFKLFKMVPGPLIKIIQDKVGQTG